MHQTAVREVEHGGKMVELKLVKVKTDALTGLYGVFKAFSTQRGGAANAQPRCV